MYKQLNDKVNYYDLEKQIRASWESNDIFHKSISTRAGARQFTFFEGPPTANGRPGIHHVMARALKDIVCRYRTMLGYQVLRKAGWDTHGLPVEIEVEKKLGFKTKDDIVKFGIGEFNRECRESVWKYKSDWEELTRMMGYWVDLDRPYITFENYYIESIWWALKQFYDKGLMYKGYKIQPYCPHCETPLSSHEVSLGYKDVKDPSVYVKMHAKNLEHTSFLVWTTTPWTLLSNVALAVHPDVDYVKVRHGTEYLILAEARLSVLEDGAEVVERMKGKDLERMEYEPLFSFHKPAEKSWFVILGDFVTTEDGSGIVHIAPAYGEDDFQVSRKYGLPIIHAVDRSGKFTAENGGYAGKFVKDADAEIVAELKSRGRLFRKEQYLHSYPHCWRCSSPLLYYLRDSWYIRTTEYAERMEELNRSINWVPPEVGTGRFGNWLAENKDWALSRDRFWGTPLPIWICEKCGEQKAVGSIEELRKGKNLPEPLDLHKPFIDNVTFRCTACSGEMRRVPEVIDVWFDSGSMPFAQWHYPFENKELFESAYPADFISEGIDQTRGWFYTLHAIGTFLFGKPAFKSVLVNELILDKDGHKMSKSKGNAVDPFVLIEKYGADATRWYLIVSSPVWRPTLFSEEGIAEVQRKFFSTLLNTYSFFALYANIDKYSYQGATVPVKNRPEIDRWIVSELNSLIRRYREYMDAYDLTKAARAVSDFTVDLVSNWYVRRNRRRFWKSDPGKDKSAAYETLFETLLTVAKLTAPLAPFISDELYGNLTASGGPEREESVHMARIPEPNIAFIDEALERKMERAIRIVQLARSMRVKANLKVRQPLSKMLVPVGGEAEKNEIESLRDVILDEINVKQLEYITEQSEIVKRKAKPNFKTLGPRFGKDVQRIAARLRELSNAEIFELERVGRLSLTLGDSQVDVTAENVEILHEEIKGWLVESDGVVTVALDTTLTDELVKEGFAREFVNRIQNKRKDSGLDVTDRIEIEYVAQEPVSAALEQLKEYIQQETLCVSLRKAANAGKETGWAHDEVNGEKVAFIIRKTAV